MRAALVFNFEIAAESVLSNTETLQHLLFSSGGKAWHVEARYSLDKFEIGD